MSVHYPARRVFEVPELVDLICSFVRKRNLTNLLTVSQCVFHCVAPLIWKDVTGVVNIIRLLPKLDIEEVVRIGAKVG